MKNSGIEWIGNIPDGWELQSLKGHLTEIKESNDPIKTAQVLSNKLGVIPYEEKGEHGNKSKENLSEYKLAYPNTIVANSMNILIGSVGLCNYFGCVSPVYYVFKPKNEEELKFLDYIFQSQPFQKELRRYAKGILEIRLRVSSGDILKQHIAFPSVEQQNKIVDYLENKLAQVDDLIANQQAQIEKLKEYKQSVITEAVTKGLDKSAPLKDSGIDWIGEINLEHSVWKLKYLLQSPMMYGANESGEMYSENSVRYIRITDITMDSQLKDTEENLYLSTEKAQPYLLKDEDVLFARSGGTVGKSFIYKSEYGLSAFAGYLIKAECDKEKLLPEYLFFYTQSSLYELWKNMIFIQATIQNIGANKYSNMGIIIPSIEGQHKILNYLKGKCSQIDRLIAIKQEKIEKLQEYKKSLIYEYVTGKKEIV